MILLNKNSEKFLSFEYIFINLQFNNDNIFFLILFFATGNKGKIFST